MEEVLWRVLRYGLRTAYSPDRDVSAMPATRRDLPVALVLGWRSEWRCRNAKPRPEFDKQSTSGATLLKGKPADVCHDCRVEAVCELGWTSLAWWPDIACRGQVRIACRLDHGGELGSTPATLCLGRFGPGLRGPETVSHVVRRTSRL